MGLFSFLASKLQRRRFSIQTRNNRNFVFGAIYTFRYTNWKNDPNPIAWCQYGGMRTGYYHGININYLSFSDKQWLARTIYLLARGNQTMDGLTFYKFLKINRPSIVKTAYRTYFSNMIMNPKLIAFGLNSSMYKMIYPHNDPFIKNLNATLMPSNMPTSPSIAFSEEELRTRILQSQSSIDITRQTVQQPTGPGGRASFLQNTNRKAEWL